MSTAAARCERAAYLIDAGRAADAEAEVAKLLASDPGNAHAMRLRALALNQMDRHGEAIHQAQTAVSTQPGEAANHRVLSILLSSRGITHNALAAIDRAVEIAPNSASNHVQRGVVLFQMHRYEDSLAACDAALAIDPHHVRATNLRTHALTSLHREDEAGESARDGLRMDPTNPLAHASYARQQLLAGEFESSRDAFRESLKLDPQSPSARVGLRATTLSHHASYRALLHYHVWFARQRRVVREAVARGGYYVALILAAITVWPPVIHAAIMAVAIIALGFIYMSSTWDALILLTDARGRLLLTRDESVRAAVLFAVLVIALTTGVLAALAQSQFACVSAVVLMLFATIASRYIKAHRARSE